MVVRVFGLLADSALLDELFYYLLHPLPSKMVFESLICCLGSRMATNSTGMKGSN
jgi:hypothetical protein